MMKFIHKSVVGLRWNGCQSCLLFVDLDQIDILTIIYKSIIQRETFTKIKNAKENNVFKLSESSLMKTVTDVNVFEGNSILYLFEIGNQKDRMIA